MAAVGLLCSAIGGAGAQETEPAQLIQTIMAGADYQRELPNGAESEGQRVAPPLVEEAPAAEPSSSVEDPSPLRGLGGVALAVLWTLLIAAVVLVAVYLVGGTRRRYRGAGEPAPAADDRRSAAPSVGLGGDARDGSGHGDGRADRLASQGDVVEAVHLLLLMALDHLRHRIGASLQPSLTSRELLDRLGLSEEQRVALGALVQAVEIGHFGGRRLAPDDYYACRDHYARLVRPADGAAA